MNEHVFVKTHKRAYCYFEHLLNKFPYTFQLNAGNEGISINVFCEKYYMGNEAQALGVLVTRQDLIDIRDTITVFLEESHE